MSDQNTPQNPPQPPPAPTGGTPPPPAYGGAPDAPVPGKTLGIVAFVLSFFLQLIALILGIVALVQSKKAGVSNGWAVAAIIISSVLLVVGIIVIIVVVLGALGLAATCGELGPGTHLLENGTVLTCG